MEMAVGAYLGQRVMGNFTETLGLPSHYEPILNYTQIGKQTDYFYLPDPPMFIPYSQPVYNATIVGQKWVESTLETHTYPAGAILGGSAGLTSVIPTGLGLSHLSERFERKSRKNKKNEK